MKEEYETIDLRELFLLVKKNILMILAVTIASAAVGFLISAFLLSPQYEASATLIVNSREDQTAQTTITNDQITSATKLVDTYSVILTSDTVLDKAIADLELTLDYEELLDKVTVESVNGTQIMKISVQDEDPVLAQSIVANIVEQAPAGELFRDPKHPYTIGLLNAIPVITKDRKPLSAIEGMVPNPTERIKGCSFWPRCPHATERCRTVSPPMKRLSEERKVRCWLFEDQAAGKEA